MCHMIININDKIHFYHCPNRIHEKKIQDPDGTAPEYFSHKHAEKEGWSFTMDEKWSSDGELVAVCPQCNHTTALLNRLDTVYATHCEQLPKEPDKFKNWAEKEDLKGMEVIFVPDQPFYKKVLDLIDPNDVVFDAGAGDFRLSYLMAQVCQKVYAVEVNPLTVSHALETFGYDMPPNLITIRGNFRQIPMFWDVTTIVMLMRHYQHELPGEWKNKRLITNAFGNDKELLVQNI